MEIAPIQHRIGIVSITVWSSAHLGFALVDVQLVGVPVRAGGERARQPRLVAGVGVVQLERHLQAGDDPVYRRVHPPLASLCGRADETEICSRRHIIDFPSHAVQRYQFRVESENYALVPEIRQVEVT